MVFGGLPRIAFESVIQGRAELLISPMILDEVIAVLSRPKFSLQPYLVREIFFQIFQLATMVETSSSVSLVKSDPDDNRILECAADGTASAIVSGDSDLLKLKIFRNIPIMTVAEFLKWIDAE
jgi:putative PIN family toxin of toxin-antitoxin system